VEPCGHSQGWASKYIHHQPSNEWESNLIHFCYQKKIFPTGSLHLFLYLTLKKTYFAIFVIQSYIRKIEGQSPVVYACNSSYLGGEDQEDHGSKPAQANNSQDPISKKTHHKKDVDSGFKPQYHKKIKIKKKRTEGRSQKTSPFYKTLLQRWGI
jgi:hypothetical protein